MSTAFPPTAAQPSAAGFTQSTLKRGTFGEPPSRIQGHSGKFRRKRLSKQSVNSEEDEDPMGSSFLQFCAACEKQIRVPSTTMLYCSESCRQKDAKSGQQYPLFVRDFSTSSLPSVQLARCNTFESDTSIEAASFNSKRSLAQFTPPQSGQTIPTFPLAVAYEISRRPRVDRSNSEAALWLAEFRQNPTSPSRSRRQSPSRDANPGLTNSASSSLGTAASLTLSTPSNRRALPQRHPPWSSAYSLQSPALVTPITYQFPISASLDAASSSGIATATADFQTLDQQSSYEKRSKTRSQPSLAQGALRQLFESEETRMAPKVKDAE